MKKMLFGLIATVMFGFTGSANQNIDNTINNSMSISKKTLIDDLIKIKIHIEWGRKSLGCKGFGICSTDIEIDVEAGDIFKGFADEKGKLALEMTSAGLESINKQFGSNAIIIEEDFQLSDSVCEQLRLRRGYVIKVGKYAVQKNILGDYSVVL